MGVCLRVPGQNSQTPDHIYMIDSALFFNSILGFVGKLTDWVAARDLDIMVTYICEVCAAWACVSPGQPSVLI